MAVLSLSGCIQGLLSFLQEKLDGPDSSVLSVRNISPMRVFSLGWLDFMPGNCARIEAFLVDIPIFRIHLE